VVVSGAPFHCTVAPERKLVPFTVSVKVAPPAIAEAGLRPVMTGVGATTVNVTAADGLPLVFVTVMFALPALAMKLAGTDAVNWVERSGDGAVSLLAPPLGSLLSGNLVEPTSVVVSGVPFHCTVAPVRKPVPLTVRVNAGPPAVAEVGLRLEMTGVGTPIGRATPGEALPPLLIAVMVALPEFAIKLACTDAVS
jgi:hypothetical protein